MGRGVTLKAPFPYFGGKSRAANIVWDRFGDVPNYVEPFFGSGAVLLNRPTSPGTETINDLDCHVANFWRSLQHDPDALALHADRPVNEADQHAIHSWLCSREEFRERMNTELEYYDAQIAGRWLWGISIWIGSGWCAAKRPSRQLPHLGTSGRGVNRQLPHLGCAGRGVEDEQPIYAYMNQLAARLRRVRVCCGDWSRVVTPTVTWKHGITGVFIDPPYSEGDVQYAAGGTGTDLSAEAMKWAITNGDNRDLRIALCGYEGHYQMPYSWECVAWKAAGGYATDGANSARERIWFSPHCLSKQGMLWAAE